MGLFKKKYTCECTECGKTFKSYKNVFVCPDCLENLEFEEEEYDEDDYPDDYGCRTCGNYDSMYPACLDSCPMGED